MKRNISYNGLSLLIATAALFSAVHPAQRGGQETKHRHAHGRTTPAGLTLAVTTAAAHLGHPTPHVDQLAKEGAMFTSWYGQASCTAGRASFMTGRIPIRSCALDRGRSG